MKRLLSDRPTQIRAVRHVLLVLVVLSAVVCIIGFHVKRQQWRRYYQQEIDWHGMDEWVTARFADCMIITAIAITIIFTLVYIYLIVKQIVVGILVVSVLQLVSLVYSASVIGKPIALEPHEWVVTLTEMILGFVLVYLLRAKAREEDNSPRDEKECFSA